MKSPPPVPQAPDGPIAYLTGEYPKVSHTFILREATALRQMGFRIETCSIRKPLPADVKGPAEAAAAAETFFVLDAARNPLTLIGAHVRAFGQSPGRWFRALRLAWRTRPDGIKNGLWQMFYFLEAAVLARHLRRIGARHLHNHFASSSCSVAMLTAEMTGLPYSFTLHGPTELFAPEFWRLDEKIARAAFSAYISHFARSQGMLFSDPAHWDRMRIVHCGIEPERYAPDPGARQGNHLVFVGRLSGVKGAPLVLEAVARLLPRHPDLRLTMVGDGPERAALEARAAALGVTDSVRFTGFLTQAEVAQTLARADIFTLPSFAEGVPVVLMEAMAASLPVVTTRIAGIPELVEDGVSGLVVPPGDLDGLTAALERLLPDAALRQRMGEAGRARVAEDYRLTTEAAWLGALFAGSLAGRLPETLRPVAAPADPAA